MQRGLDRGHLAVPFLALVLSPVVATAPLSPVVVLWRPSPIERALFLEQALAVHGHSLAPTVGVRPQCSEISASGQAAYPQAVRVRRHRSPAGNNADPENARLSPRRYVAGVSADDRAARACPPCRCR
jgi:hypothetical protein